MCGLRRCDPRAYPRIQTLALAGHNGCEQARRWEPKRLASATVLHLRPGSPHRPPSAAAPGRHRPVHRARAGRPRRADSADHATSSRLRLSSATPVPTTQEPGRPVEPAPTRATSAKPSHPDAILMPTRAQHPDNRDDRQDHERSGLTPRPDARCTTLHRPCW
jgi:hypothetical protein